MTHALGDPGHLAEHNALNVDITKQMPAADIATVVTPHGYVGELSVYSHGAAGAIVGLAYNDTPANSAVFPVGVNGVGRVDNDGTAVFGAYLVSETYNALHGGGCAAEVDSFNYGGPASAVYSYPPNRGFGGDFVPTGLLLGAGGTYDSFMALSISQEGSAPRKWVTGIYIDPNAIRDYPLYIGGGGVFPSLILGNGAQRTLTNVAAAFGQHNTDDATGAQLLIGTNPGNVPYLAASLSQGAATDLMFLTNNTEQARIHGAGGLLIQTSALVNASSSTNVAPATLGFSGLNGAGNAAQLQLGDAFSGIQNAFGDKVQMYAYAGIEIRGGRAALSSPAFVANAAAPAATAIVNEVAGQVAFGVQGAAGQSTDLADFLVGATLLAAVTKDGAIRPGNGAAIGGSLFSGSGAPGAIGANGDFYLRTDTPGTANQRLYVKSAGAWTGIL